MKLSDRDHVMGLVGERHLAISNAKFEQRLTEQSENEPDRDRYRLHPMQVYSSYGGTVPPRTPGVVTAIGPHIAYTLLAPFVRCGSVFPRPLHLALYNGASHWSDGGRGKQMSRYGRSYPRGAPG